MGNYSVVVLDFETTGLSPDHGDRVIEVGGSSGAFHRALADAEMTGHLWVEMIRDLKGTYGLRNVPFNLMLRLAKVSRKAAPGYLEKFALEDR